MQISPINYNQATNFNGSVDKSIKNYIKGHVKEHIKTSLHKANEQGYEINKKDLTKIKDIATSMMTKLDNFMEKLHPDTKLKYETGFISGPRVYLQNGKDKVPIRKASSAKISNSEIYLQHEKPMFEEDSIKRFNYDGPLILSRMSEFIDEFTALNAKQIDEAMLSKKFANAKFEIEYFYETKNFFNFGLKMKKAINSFFKFAKDVGKSENAESMIQEAKEKAMIEAKESQLKHLNKQKEKAKIVKDNNSFVKELLNQ